MQIVVDVDAPEDETPHLIIGFVDGCEAMGFKATAFRMPKNVTIVDPVEREN